ncbi:hypothetical protein IWQ61_008541 [Dispira simplex]|nr:hypothetical protein IWQ61_008541 [Dispira simplex]
MSQRVIQEPPVLPSTPPQPSPQLYKDLLIFEERLKQNVRRLKRKKRKYRDEGFQAFKALYFQRKRSLSALRSVRHKDDP